MNEIMMNVIKTGAATLVLSFIAIQIVPVKKETEGLGMGLALVFLVGLAIFIIGVMGVIWS